MVSSIYKHILPRMRVRNDDPIPAKTKKKKTAARAAKKKKTAASAAKKKIKTTTEYEYPSFKPIYPRMRVSNIWCSSPPSKNTTRVCFDCDTNTSDPTGSKVISSSFFSPNLFTIKFHFWFMQKCYSILIH